MVPAGKGLFLRRTTGAEAFARFLRAQGFTFVAPFDRELIRQLPALAPFYRAQGLRVYPILYNHMATWQQELEQLVGAATAAEADGIILNPEVTFKDHEAAAQSFMRTARSMWSRALGIATYPRTRFHPTFPWRVFARYADFGLPLTFDRDDAWSKADVVTGIREWHEVGFKPLILGAGAYSMRGSEFRTKTPAELRRHLATLPPCRGACVFSLPDFQASPEDYPEQWAILKRWDPQRMPALVRATPFGRLFWQGQL
ncbi:MAG: hypothetical protein JSV86_19875 [Gemmatimonadota bacterium]|nr:MAG: hypothetical protein JSV86_19875 [Gemmatimonadota bacterium]